ncbi:MAG: lamin tail domain-containing protein [Saprospiraceae bacterium]|nr:lamin tail domain-containing protein [Saprospiraceae bacterium]
MKKSLLALFFLIGLFNTGRTQVIITEIMYNPPESGVDSLEYIEIHNFNNLPADISGWSFSQGIVYTFPAGTVMAPGGYLVLAKSASAFQSVFGFAPGIVWSSNDALTNGGEDIELRDAAGTVKDYVDYLNASPWPAEANGTGPSIVLCDFNADNSLAGNWQAAPTGTGVIINGNEVKGNPGAPSNCTGTNEITANDDNLVAPSGQTSLLNVQGNDLIVNALTLFIIVTPPSQGSATISGNFVSYQPNPGYCGPDQFTYQICDDNGCDEATVSLTVKCYPQRSIGSVSGENPEGVADSLNVDCELTGTVYGVNLRPINNNQPALLFTIIDNNGDGIAVSSLNGNYGYTVKEKDRITVRGTIGQFNGLTEIRPDTVIKLSENNMLLSPVVVSNLSEATESRLVKINNLHFVDPAEWTTGSGSSGFNVRVVSDDFPNDTIQLRIDRDVETYNASVPGQPFDLTGIGGQFDASNPYNTGYQILPRYNPDISTLTSVKEADFSAKVILSPNPVGDLLTIQMDLDFDRITLLRANGSVIKSYRRPGPQQKVDVSLLPAGAYFVRFEKDGKTWSAKFVK